MKAVVYTLLIVSVISTITGLSQDVDERKITFRTLCLERVIGIEKVVITAASGAKSADIPLYTDISPEVQGVFKSNEAAFYIEKVGLDGEPRLELVGKCPIGKSARQLFVFLPSNQVKGKLAYQVRSFDDDTTVFPMGHNRAINLAPVPVRFVLSGATSPAIPPGKHAQFPHSKRVNDYNMYPVVIEFLSPAGGWIKGQSVSWKATNRRREIVLTFIDSRFKQPTVRIYTDFPPWMESPLETAQP